MRKSRLAPWLPAFSGAVVVLILAAIVVAVFDVGQRMGLGAPSTEVEKSEGAASGGMALAEHDVDYCLDPGLTWKQVTPPDSPLLEPSLTVTVTRHPLPVATPIPDPSGGRPTGGIIESKWNIPPEPESDDLLVRRTDVIAVATVVRCGPGEWGTPDGKMPPLKDGQWVGSIPRIYRPMVLRVETPVRGDAHVGQELTVRLAGGTADGFTHVISGFSYGLKRGSRVLVIMLQKSQLRPGSWSIIGAASIDGSGIGTDVYRPKRQFPLDERIQQLELAWDRARR